ncbi:hypothetical protein WA026_003770 [Henosepilachna vigintioctopunctata]|uniref:Protein SERAC1 n=1 Tax=Henosepilachna vigintioctopunctata TaxID=420089 RepID=A0AAW1U8R7_9CUCU
MVCQIRSTKDILSNAIDLSVLKLWETRMENPLKLPAENTKPEYIILNDLKTDNLSRIWDSLKFTVAEKLIGLCHNENDFVRIKALVSLGKIRNLDHGHFSVLSNMIDKDIAVRLARLRDVDLRLLKEPPLKYLKYDHSMIVNEMKDLLLDLSEMSNHSCLEYFVSNAFFNAEDSNRFVDNDTTLVEIAKIGQNGQDILPVCLESLLHHASIEVFAEDIVKMNAFSLLSEIHSRFIEDINVNVTLCRIISYLSLHKEVLEELHTTGWIRILAEWMKHDDVRISIPATRALANLEEKEESYKGYIYLLHPNYINKREPKVDVVFVHGLLGGVFFTWRQRTKNDSTIGLLGKGATSSSTTKLQKKESVSQTIFMPGNRKKKQKNIQSSEPHTMQYIRDFEEDDLNEVKDYEVVLEDIPTNGSCTASCGYSFEGDKLASVEDNDYFTYCWPRDWLAEDCSDLRIIGANYDTTLSKWYSFCPHISGKTNIEEQSLKLLNNLLQAGIGKRPVVWVTHSMGGLLVKNILCEAFHSSDSRLHELVENTKGIVFYSTPHLGSNLATFNPASQLVLRLSIEVQDLREGSPFLLELHDKFLKILESVPIKVITFVETKKTVFTALKFNFQLVTPESGNTGSGEYYEIPLDHLSICKPVSRYSFLYRKVLTLIRDIVKTPQ